MTTGVSHPCFYPPLRGTSSSQCSFVRSWAFRSTQLLAAGAPVRTVAGRLSHANAATTLNIYAHVLESSDEDAAGVLGPLLAEPS